MDGPNSGLSDSLGVRWLRSLINPADCGPERHVCATLYIRVVRFEWDETKNQSNLVKHGIDFRDAGTGEFIRILSARQATRHERKLYEEAHR